MQDLVWLLIHLLRKQANYSKNTAIGKETQTGSVGLGDNLG